MLSICSLKLFFVSFKIIFFADSITNFHFISKHFVLFLISILFLYFPSFLLPFFIDIFPVVTNILSIIIIIIIIILFLFLNQNIIVFIIIDSLAVYKFHWSIDTIIVYFDIVTSSKNLLCAVAKLSFFYYLFYNNYSIW